MKEEERRRKDKEEKKYMKNRRIILYCVDSVVQEAEGDHEVVGDS